MNERYRVVGEQRVVTPGQRQVVTATQGHFLGVALTTGELLWRVPVPRWDVQQCITPVQYKDLIILQCDQEMGDGSFITALKRRTGEDS